LPVRSDIQRRRRDHRRVFRLQVALGVGGMVTAVAAVASATASVHPAPMAVHHLEIASLRFTYPALNLAAALLLALAAPGAAVMTIALHASWRQRRAYLSFMRQIGILGPLEGHPSVTVIEDPRPQAFCAGYLRPAVYVSRRTLELLSDAELQAVLAHEHHHRHARDPLRFALARVFSQALFFLPVLRALRDRYGELAELRADDAAIRASEGEKGPLASALLVFEASGPPQVAGISPQRVDSLLGQPVHWRLPSWLIGTSLLGLASVIALLWRASEIAAAHATLNLPILSSQPCLMVLTLLALALCMRMLMPRMRSAA
jgi:Zn-dependent protease with chaperone function